MNVYQTEWIPQHKLIHSVLSGDLEIPEIEIWEASLHRALGQITNYSIFRIFINLHGFTAVNIEAHKRFRSIIPQVLSLYNWKVGYVDMFPEEALMMSFKRTRGIQCVAAAHAHHDKGKISRYESDFGRDNERYFTDPERAWDWIINLDLSERPTAIL